MSDDNVDLSSHQIGGNLCSTLTASLAIMEFEDNVPAVGVAKPLQAAAESVRKGMWRYCGDQSADARKFRTLLRSCCERPCCRAAEQRDELATLELIELHPLPPTVERQDSGLASIKSGLVALRDFDAALDRFGSKARITAAHHLQPLFLNKETCRLSSNLRFLLLATTFNAYELIFKVGHWSGRRRRRRLPFHVG